MSSSQNDDGFPLQGLTVILLHAGLLLRHALILLAVRLREDDQLLLPDTMASPGSVSRASVDSTTATAAVTIDATTQTLDDDQRIPVQAATIIMYDSTLPDTQKARDVIEPEAITTTARNIDDTEALDQDLAKRSTANKHEK
jgi:hypothetical protein